MRTEADEIGMKARELERAEKENEFLLFTGLALSVEFQGEAENARSNVNALYSPRSESSDAAPVDWAAPRKASGSARSSDPVSPRSPF